MLTDSQKKRVRNPPFVRVLFEFYSILCEEMEGSPVRSHAKLTSLPKSSLGRFRLATRLDSLDSLDVLAHTG